MILIFRICFFAYSAVSNMLLNRILSLCRSSEPEVNVGELLEKLKVLARNPKLKEWAEKSGSELMAELNGQYHTFNKKL